MQQEVPQWKVWLEQARNFSLGTLKEGELPRSPTPKTKGERGVRQIEDPGDLNDRVEGSPSQRRKNGSLQKGKKNSLGRRLKNEKDSDKSLSRQKGSVVVDEKIKRMPSVEL